MTTMERQLDQPRRLPLRDSSLAPEAHPHENREVQELRLLLEVSQVLDQSMDLRDVMVPVLKAMSERMGMLRGTITLLNPENNQITIEAAYGLSAQEQQRGRYQLGEGVTGQVVKTGQPMVVPRVGGEAVFLNRTGARGHTASKADIAFICVPIKMGNAAIGSLSADRLFAPGAGYDDDVRVLTIIASMIAQAVRLRQAMNHEHEWLLQENTRLQEQLKDRFRPANIIGNSKVMQDVYDMIAKVSHSDATVLIRGESGVGKELVAHAVHFNSRRANMPFIRVNCAALPQTVLESELFGHEKGAFTGALNLRKGRFELAHGGTIFLDEIGDFPPTTQVALLRVLQEREFERVGGAATIKTDVRVIAATNRDLEAMMHGGQFRQDLYYRLNVFPVHVPPLRDRPSDILLLADFFVEKYGKANHKSVRRISTPAIDMLVSYHWPGNVRELENCIERAVLLTNDEVIHAHNLPPTLQTADASGTMPAGTLDATLDAVERDLIVDALKTADGNMAKAARVLGITERQMGLRVKKHGFSPKRFRKPAP